MTLEGIEDELPGVISVAASYHKQLMDVEFDESKVTIDQIVEAAGKMGYEASVLTQAA